MGLACQRLETAFYRPRKPQDSPLYQLVEQYFDEFKRVYPERYQQKYGFWRPVIGDAVAKFAITLRSIAAASRQPVSLRSALKCGDAFAFLSVSR